MRIAVYGTGGAGGFFGARLARAGEDVVFIARGEHLEAIRREGLRIESVEGDFEIKPTAATDEPSDAGPVDAVLVGVKAWQVREAATAMKPLVGPETFVVPLQNGVEAPALLSAVLGPERVLGGLAKVFGFIVGPGRIRHLGGPANITFGELDNARTGRVERLRAALSGAGIDALVPPDIHVALWEKFLFIAPLGGLGAVTRAPLGTMRELPETRRLLEQGMAEIAAVGRARRIALADDVVARTMAFVDTLPANGTFSMQRDIADGKPSELDAWTGAVVRLGREAGVPTPLNAFLYQCLLPLELKARGRLQFPG